MITSTKQISPSVLKALAGKAGPAGAQGAAGPQGQTGSGGTKGETGAEGKPGPEGKPGSQGATCAKGTTGATGPQGATGEPWTAGGRLPSGKTETGTWAFPHVARNGFIELVPIAFTIPLAKQSANVEVLTLAQTKASVGSHKCEYATGDPEAMLVAPAGYLCVVTVIEESEGGKILGATSPAGTGGDAVTGTFLRGQSYTEPEEIPAFFGVFELRGVWAVTGG